MPPNAPTTEFQPEWTTIIAQSQCGTCGELGADGRTVWTPAPPPAYARLSCSQGHYVRWLPAPKEGKRAANSWARAHWKRHDGGLILCSLCGAREGENDRVLITIHHRERVEDNPDREHDLYNTLPLCADCHTIAEALRAHRLHTLGRSARTGA